MTFRFTNITLILLFVGLLNFGLYAQHQESNAFSKISFGGSYLKNVFNDDLDDFWTVGHGGVLEITTPFYAGQISIGINFIPFNGRTDNRPDFKTYFFFLSWGKEIKLASSLSTTIGVKIGSFNMIFDDNTLSEFEKNESEFAIGSFANIELSITDHVSIYTGTEITNVFTNKQLKFWNAYGGVKYNIVTPAWLRDILK